MGEKLSISLHAAEHGASQAAARREMTASWEHGDGPWAWGLEGLQTSCSPARLGLAVPHATFQHATCCYSPVPSVSGGQLLEVLVWAEHLSTPAVMGKVEGMGKELKAGTISGCISLASPFSLKNGPSAVHLKPYVHHEGSRLLLYQFTLMRLEKLTRKRYRSLTNDSSLFRLPRVM